MPDLIAVETDHPIALTSPDHMTPWGTRHDSSVKLAFNTKLHTLLGWPLKILDLGCAGGGMVRSFLAQGSLAVGIEGSDYSLVNQRAEWPNYPGNLFTADITQPFAVTQNGEPLLFDAVTLWDVIEHIAMDDLPAVMGNIDRHLRPGGHLIMTISTAAEIVEGMHLHQTVRPQWWWRGFLSDQGWADHPETVEFFHRDFVRDAQNAPHSFPVVLTRKAENV